MNHANESHWSEKWARCVRCLAAMVRSPRNANGCHWCGGELRPLDEVER